jgi:hypothetical protein
LRWLHAAVSRTYCFLQIVRQARLLVAHRVADGPPRGAFFPDGPRIRRIRADWLFPENRFLTAIRAWPIYI